VKGPSIIILCVFGAAIVSLLGFAFTAPDMSNVDESLSVEVAQIQSGNYSTIFASYLVSSQAMLVHYNYAKITTITPPDTSL